MSAEQMSREYAAERRAAQAKEAQVAEVMRLADEYASAAMKKPAEGQDEYFGNNWRSERAALEAAVRKLARFTAQSSADQTPADSATASPKTE